MLNEIYDDKRPFSFSITALATVFWGAQIRGNNRLRYPRYNKVESTPY